jgi:UTP--glucose-1-phosphate uridylyltransferase
MQLVNASRIKKAVFPVGGFGTRFLPATKSMPKEMLPVANKPLVQYAFEEAKQAGIEQFIFIIGRNKHSIIDHFDQAFELERTLSDCKKFETLGLTQESIRAPGEIIFVRQQQPLGLGHAVWCARHVIGDEPFAVLLADELFIDMNDKGAMSQMINKFEAGDESDNIIAVSEIDIKESSQYGIIKYTASDPAKILDMVEKPTPEHAPSNLAIVGRYILQPQIFDYLSQLAPGMNGEIQLTDAMRAMIKDQHSYNAFKVLSKRLDCGNYPGFLEANIRFAMQNSTFSAQVQHMIKKIAAE